jgi:hypothetical protein
MQTDTIEDTMTTTAPPKPSIKGEMTVMDHTGDYKIIWDSDKPDEVDQARKTFNDLKAKGYAAFKVTGKDGTKGEQTKTFDSHEERLIMVPAVAGG